MSVINRIEIASLLNKHGDVSSPWEAKMRHLMLNLRGQSTAMNMENGFGKTTLSDALIGMLSRDRTLIRKTKQKMSPSRDGRPWTHIRVEFSFSSEPVAQTDILAAAGDSVGGTEQWVFGLYGHTDTDPGYYYYQGRLEQLPVSAMTADSKLQLFSNEHFKHALQKLKPQRPKDRESWLEAISLPSVVKNWSSWPLSRKKVVRIKVRSLTPSNLVRARKRIRPFSMKCWRHKFWPEPVRAKPTNRKSLLKIW